MFTLYQILKRGVAESVLDRASGHTRNAAFEAVSAPEQYCSAPLLKSGTFRTRIGYVFENVRIKPEHFYWSRNCNGTSFWSHNLFKSKGSIANCMPDRAPIHIGDASEQFLRSNRTLILVHTVPEQLLKRSKNLSGTV